MDVKNNKSHFNKELSLSLLKAKFDIQATLYSFGYKYAILLLTQLRQNKNGVKEIIIKSLNTEICISLNN